MILRAKGLRPLSGPRSQPRSSLHMHLLGCCQESVVCAQCATADCCCVLFASFSHQLQLVLGGAEMSGALTGEVKIGQYRKPFSSFLKSGRRIV